MALRSRLRRIRTLALGVTAGLALMAWTAPAASAGPLVASAPSCEDIPFEQPFTPWLDYMSYTLVPGGSFEDGAAGWDLDGGAVVDGNEPFYVHGDGESHSLRLAAGDTATSATTCAGLDHPTMRFFANNDGGLLSSLKVDVLFETATGDVASLPIGAVAGSHSWQPSLPMPVVANLLPLLPDDYTPVAFRFKALGGGWRIDDVYLDPRRH